MSLLGITVDDGAQRVPINNELGEEIGCFTFHPTDIGIVERYNRLADRFGEITEPLEQLAGEQTGPADLSDPRYARALEEAGKRLYAAVDELFAGEAAAAFFGRMHPFSPVNGAFYCENVLRALGQFINDRFDTETRAMDRRVGKYLRGNGELGMRNEE